MQNITVKITAIFEERKDKQVLDEDKKPVYDDFGSAIMKSVPTGKVFARADMYEGETLVGDFGIDLAKVSPELRQKFESQFQKPFAIQL